MADGRQSTGSEHQFPISGEDRLESRFTAEDLWLLSQPHERFLQEEGRHRDSDADISWPEAAITDLHTCIEEAWALRDVETLHAIYLSEEFDGRFRDAARARLLLLGVDVESVKRQDEQGRTVGRAALVAALTEPVTLLPMYEKKKTTARRWFFARKVE